MERVEDKTEALGDEGFRASVNSRKDLDLNGEMGSENENGKVLGAGEGVIDVEADLGGGNERSSGLGVDNELKSSVEKVGTKDETGVPDEGKVGVENDIVVDDGIDVSVLVKAIDSVEGAEGSGEKCGSEDGGHKALSGEFTELKISNEVEHGQGAKKNVEENSAEGTENYDDDDDDDYVDDLGDEGHEFHVGDFVWGKIKSYPWWPGQIYDASDASDFALKLKQKNRFLVAYFGDGSFSWCSRSQLKPFVENFKEMSEQSNSKSFVYAVETCLDEVSRLVELDMTCSCVAEDDKHEASMASNSGIKEGVLVPVKNAGKSFTVQCEPNELVAKLREFAKTVSVNNMFDLTVSRGWLTAYYHAKGKYRLPSYHYPVLIQGLEDKSGNPLEVPVHGRNGEEWIPTPVVATTTGFNQSNQPFLQKCPDTAGDILYQRRKQKSVAELIEDEIRKEEGFVNESNSNELTSGKRKREDNSAAEKQDNSLIAAQSGLKKRGRKKKAVASGSPSTLGEKTSTNGDSTNIGGKEADHQAERKREDNNEAENQDNMLIAPKSGVKRGRKRKAAVTSGSPNTVGETTKDGESTDFGGKEADEAPPSKELKLTKLSGVGSEDEDEAARSKTLRERKRSKYLSPPFTNPTQKVKISSLNKESDTESEKNSRVGERMAKVAGRLIGIQATSSETPKSIEPSNNGDKSGSLNPKTAVQDCSKTDASTYLNASPSQILSEVLSAAIDPLCFRENSDIKFVKDNIATFRDARFNNPVNNHVQQNGSTKRKSEYKAEQIGNGSFGQNLEMPPDKRPASAYDNTTNNEAVERKTAPVVLLLTFPPAYSLPTKDELMKLYGKFGAVSEKETDVFYNSFCARVSYLSSSDAEEAYKASVEKSPFGTANVNYRLRYPSAAANHSESNQKAVFDNATPSQPSDDAATHLGFIREKLKMLTSILDSCDGRVSAEMKSKLEGEIKGVMEKVSSMTVTSS